MNADINEKNMFIHKLLPTINIFNCKFAVTVEICNCKYGFTVESRLKFWQASHKFKTNTALGSNWKPVKFLEYWCHEYWCHESHVVEIFVITQSNDFLDALKFT